VDPQGFSEMTPLLRERIESDATELN